METDGSGSTAVPGILDLSALPVVIDKPGTYTLDQDWDFGVVSGPETVIDIQTVDSAVILDLRGYTLTLREDGSAQSIVNLQPFTSAEIRNGSLGISRFCDGICFGTAIDAVAGSPRRLTIREADIRGGINLTDSDVTVSYSELTERVVAGNLQINDSEIRCSNSGEFCIHAFTGSIRNNTIQCRWPCEGAVSVHFSAVVDSNRLVLFDDPFFGIVIRTELGDPGQYNIIRDNFTDIPAGAQTGILVDGLLNVIKDNFGHAGPLEFRQDGNYYGGNRLLGGVILNGTVQKDWGGNGSLDGS